MPMCAKDLPGQAYLFPGMEPESEVAAAERLLGEVLPDKESVAIPEACALMSVSRRTVEHWIADGTLLATYANRHDESQRKHARIVVRTRRPYDPNRNKFLTLAELRVKRSNVGGN
jgi:hypothetical protein